MSGGPSNYMQRAAGSRGAPLAAARLNENQTAEVREVFSAFDDNKDGFLNFHELKVAARALGFELPNQQLLDMLADPPAPGSTSGRKRISRAHFETAMAPHVLQRDPEEEQRRMFDLFDEQRKGFIDFDDLRRVALALGENISDEELQTMIDVFASKNNGYVDFEDFREMLDDA